MINWKVRFRNKTFLVSFFSLLIAFIYDVMSLLNVTPMVEQGSVLGVMNMILTALGVMGVIADPTTVGLGDSKRAMTYESPWHDVG